MAIRACAPNDPKQVLTAYLSLTDTVSNALLIERLALACFEALGKNRDPSESDPMLQVCETGHCNNVGALCDLAAEVGASERSVTSEAAQEFLRTCFGRRSDPQATFGCLAAAHAIESAALNAHRRASGHVYVPEHARATLDAVMGFSEAQARILGRLLTMGRDGAADRFGKAAE